MHPGSRGRTNPLTPAPAAPPSCPLNTALAGQTLAAPSTQPRARPVQSQESAAPRPSPRCRHPPSTSPSSRPQGQTRRLGLPPPSINMIRLDIFQFFIAGLGSKSTLPISEDHRKRHSERSGSWQDQPPGAPPTPTPWCDRLRPVRCVRHILRDGLEEGWGAFGGGGAPGRRVRPGEGGRHPVPIS